MANFRYQIIDSKGKMSEGTDIRLSIPKVKCLKAS